MRGTGPRSPPPATHEGTITARNKLRVGDFLCNEELSSFMEGLRLQCEEFLEDAAISLTMQGFPLQ